jgi:hypothetical protein
LHRKTTAAIAQPGDLDEYQERLDQVGRSPRAAADLSEDPPGLELRVRAFAGSEMTGMGGVDLTLVA